MTDHEINEIFREVYRSPKRRTIVNASRRMILMFSFAVAVLAVLILVAISPLALKQFSMIKSENWAELSNIGQTYGAASAILTAIALIGVAGSMIFQIRAIEVSKSESMRGQHLHLVEMSLKDPVYMRAWGQEPKEYGGLDRYRQLLYVNLILSFWEDNYRLRSLSEGILRGDLAILFRGEAGREFWTLGRYARLRTSRNRQHSRFSRIVEEEYQKAIASAPPAVRAEETPTRPLSKRRSLFKNSSAKCGGALLLGAIAGFSYQTLTRKRID